MMMSYFFSYLSNVLVKTNWVPLVYSRKLFNSIGHWIPMMALIALGYVTSEQKNLAIGLLTLAVGINAATYLGFQVSQKFRIELIHWGNNVHSFQLVQSYRLGSKFCWNSDGNNKLLCQYYVDHSTISSRIDSKRRSKSKNWNTLRKKLKAFGLLQSNSDQWRIVFFISAGVYFFGNLLFVIFSKTNVQYWNESAKRSKLIQNCTWKT